jgi:hypothetical protein
MRTIHISANVRINMARNLSKFLKERAQVEIKHSLANQAVAALLGLNEHSLAAAIRAPGGIGLAIDEDTVTISDLNYDHNGTTNIGKRQRGDAAEALILDQLNRAGIPAFRTRTNHPGHDILAHPPGLGPQRIQVKSREFAAPTNFVGWKYVDDFDWLAVVLLNPPGYERSIFIAPRAVVDARSHNATFRNGRSFTAKNVSRKLAEFENNFRLLKNGTLR